MVFLEEMTCHRITLYRSDNATQEREPPQWQCTLLRLQAAIVRVVPLTHGVRDVNHCTMAVKIKPYDAYGVY